MRIVTGDNQEALREWFMKRDEHLNPFFCIGLMNDSKIEAVVAYSNVLKNSCHIHAQAESGDWITKEMLHAMFDYPFNVLGKRTLIAPVVATNEKVIRIVKHLKFEQCGMVPDGTDEGDAIFYVMRVTKCPWLKEKVKWVA